MKLSVPYFSQIHDIADVTWQRRACSVVNLKMVLEFFAPGVAPSIETLIKEGVAIGGFDERVGWSHDSIVRLARNHGIAAYTQEFRSVIVDPESEEKKESDRLVDGGISKLKRVLNDGKPVIVSVFPGFSENRTIHTITLFGVDEGGFFYHDPITQNPEHGKGQFISKEDFVKSWRRLAIFFD